MAVYTPVSEDDLKAFLARYEVGDLVSFVGIAEGVENSNYLVETTTSPFILTLYEKRVSETDLPFFLSLMTFLADKGVPTARALEQRTGATLGSLCGRPAALIEHLKGEATRAPSLAQCGAVGKALAQMHLATSEFSQARTNTLGPDGWRQLYGHTADRAHAVQEGLAEEIGSALEETILKWPQDLPSGVIHADLFPDNVLFEGDQLGGMIDFYFACTDAYAYDLAITLNAWCFEGVAFSEALATAMTKGYQSIRPLNGAEKSALPLLATGACLRFILTRLTDWLAHDPSALVTPHDPLALLPNLRFHQSASPSQYGV